MNIPTNKEDSIPLQEKTVSVRRIIDASKHPLVPDQNRTGEKNAQKQKMV